MRVEGRIVTVKGVQHLKITKVSMTPDVGNMKIYASNLINDNKELSKYSSFNIVDSKPIKNRKIKIQNYIQ